MWTRTTFLFGIVLLTVEAANAADHVDCHQIPECETRLDRAQALVDLKQWQAALAEFEALYADYPDPRMTYNIARMHHLLGRPAKSVPNYQRFLSSGVETDSVRVDRARHYLEQAQREAAPPPQALLPAPPPTTVPERSAPTVQETPRPAKDARKPVNKKWWLWTTLGVAVSATALGLSVGFALREPTPLPFREAIQVQ